MERQPIVEKLTELLQSNNDLRQELISALQTAKEPGIETIDDFYEFLDSIVTHIPDEKELMPSVRKFYFILGQSPVLKKHDAFNEWILEFVMKRGEFMDTKESTATLETFIKNPKYKIDDYIEGPSGWQTYNQFLARQLKPGRRPIAERCDDKVIVSPADSEFKGTWNISDASAVTAKDVTYSIQQLLEGSQYEKDFAGGIFTHSFLEITDYHRYHFPTGGVVREVRKIPGGTWVHEKRKPDGSLENIDDVGFQFTHTRGSVIIESAVGLVAIMPIGMGHISSVVFTVEEKTSVVKGEEFGYFAFGGSDIIMLFQKNRVKFSAKEKQQYKMGEVIAMAIES